MYLHGLRAWRLLNVWLFVHRSKSVGVGLSYGLSAVHPLLCVTTAPLQLQLLLVANISVMPLPFTFTYLLTYLFKLWLSGERPFSCSFCDKQFFTSSDLAVHRRQHTGERPYSCETCGKRFVQSGHLTIHRRHHSGLKPYLCEICLRAFRTSSDLACHMRRHDKDHTL